MTLDKKLNDAFDEMMKYRQSVGYATSTYRSSVPPFINFCVKNHPLSARITQEMVDAADPINSHIRDFLSFLDTSVIVAHNAQFDLNFLNAECENCGLPVTKNHAVDTLQLSRILMPEAQYHKLDFLADYLGIDKGSSHRALDDAITCMELFKKCLERA